MLSSFGFFNFDKFRNDPRPKTLITVLVPSGYASANKVLLSTNSKPNLLGTTVGKYLIELNCNIIFVTKDNGNFRYAIKPFILETNQQVKFLISETFLATVAQLKSILNAIS